ncbi:hypothetical protein DFQ27_007156 [Actinomortierella ambigua]|uniref:Uncharacterized protein n=1 Tax=Actinomortierella ambigua TaxID=1343610 RepID=A0A9P6PTP3_9FUNG|nr:hypothetical protein DFQ27_007156 [Actinomortierella ambigua]
MAVLLAFTTTSTMAQVTGLDCEPCVIKQLEAVKSCKEAKFELNKGYDLYKLTGAERACFCDVVSTPSMWDKCSSECPTETIEQLKASFKEAGQTKDGDKNMCDPSLLSQGTLSVPSKAGAALVAAAVALVAL